MTVETGRIGFDSEKANQVVRAILVTIDGLVCIGKRAPGYEGGKWCLVGGMSKGGDSSQELLREVTEETGVSTGELCSDTEPMFVSTNRRHKHGMDWDNNYFILEIDDLAIPEVMSKYAKDEFEEIRFVEKEDIEGLEFAFGDGEMLVEFFETVGK